MVSRRELTRAYTDLTGRLIKKSGDDAATIFRNLGSWRDEDFNRFYLLISKRLTGAALTVARLEIAYYQEIAKLSGQSFTIPAFTATDVSVESLRRGVPAEAVYARPFKEMYTALSQGKRMTDAIELGATRISSIVSTDLQLARSNAGFAARSKNDRIVGYARVLSGNESCALCYVASTQRYHRGDLLPIHPGCDCGTTPIYSDREVDQVIDEARLAATSEVIQNTFGTEKSSWDLSKISIRDHGEIGPMLTIADNDFTGPDDIPDRYWVAQDRRRRTSSPERLAALRTARAARAANT